MFSLWVRRKNGDWCCMSCVHRIEECEVVQSWWSPRYETIILPAGEVTDPARSFGGA